MEIRNYIKVNLILLVIVVTLGVLFNFLFSDNIENGIKRDSRDLIKYVNTYKYYNGYYPDNIDKEYKLRNDNKLEYVKFNNGYKFIISNDESDNVSIYDSRTGKIYKMINTKYEFKNIYNDIYNDFTTSQLYYDYIM